MRVIILIFFLLGGAWAQEIPVEIDLVPPPTGSGVTLIVTSAPLKPREAEWLPPPMPCRICDEIKREGACPCLEPLTQPLAEALLIKVRRAVSRATLQKIELKRPLVIRAVSGARLRVLGGERLLGLYEDGVIWVSHDLNRRQAIAVIAHEVGHAWFFENRPDVDTPNELLFEGFAEWVSYLALAEIGDSEAASRIEHEDQSVYGRGARKLIARYRRDGLESVLALVLTERAL